MKLIVGLGNPGLIYARSRHNVGFSVVKALGRVYKISLKKDRGAFALTAKARIGHQNVILAMPLTFMNLSGIAVKNLARQYAIDFDNLLVVCDDLDLELGRLRIRPSGSSGGHRGLKSIIESLDSDSFARLRVGIGRPPHQLRYKDSLKYNWCGGRPGKECASDYVLSPFARKEQALVKSIIEDACECCQAWATQGITKTMNIFNKERKYNE